ncbi:MAG: 16S rRNA (guanine(527)-N(7))-methyltransferase RsmG [Thermodesulfobacteriota bacterium]
MNKKDFTKMLVEGGEALGVGLDDRATRRFLTYLEELKRWNRKINLTSVTSDREILIRHFLDSLTLAGPIRALKLKKILDIGSGAGFPGLPLKIAAPELEVVLVDSVKKKVFFLRHIIRTLALDGTIKALHGRAGDFFPGGLPVEGEGFDCVTSRAFSRLKGFLALAFPYCRKGGYVIALKGPSLTEELREAEDGGFGAPFISNIKLPFSDRTTTLVRFGK